MRRETPFFSIIVPTYNRPAQLGLCLTYLSRLEYEPDRFEVIVVDDGSKMSLDAVIARFRGKLDVTLFTQQNSGPAIARNAGAARAKGQFLAFTDDDCAPASSWLRTLATRSAQESEQFIAGRSLNVLSGNPYSTVSQTVADYLINYYNSRPDQARFCSGNNLAMPYSTFRAVGGYNTTFPLGAGEDRELSDRLLYCNYRLVYAPEVVVYHFHELTLTTFVRQHFNYGRGSLQFYQARARRNNQPIIVESKSFYVNLLLYPFPGEWGFRRMQLRMLLALSQVTNGAGHFWARGHRNRKGCC
ncbi:MAG: glycosyltransferase [Deltaproteobacteria bacterium]|nr:glycosyltransferase [Deltaproteobacteria bacterium]